MQVRRQICAILIAAGMISVSPLSAAAEAPSPDGEKLFRQQCSVCHSTEPNVTKMGPSMFGVVGRKAGAVEGFRYSPAMRASELIWDAATLDAYIESPRKLVPNTNMSFPGQKNAEKRAALIEYLEAFK